jgi:UDP-N-acetylglucosamine 2-epimerase (non-hydrolysing)
MGEYMRVCTVISTRPEIIKMSRTMPALDKAVQHTIIHTSQNWDYELRDIFFEQMGLRKPDYTLDTKGSTAIAMTADIMVKLEALLSELKPDAVLVLGDTNGCLATGLVAAKLHIRFFHLEAGNRCFSEDTPEEINRTVLDHLPGIQLPYSERSRENLMREGLHTGHVIKVGSPMFEVLDFYRPQIVESNVLDKLSLTPGEYFVVSVHREENVNDHFGDFIALLNRLADFGQRIIVTCHPRTRKRLDETRIPFNGLVEFHRPFGFFDYVNLQQNARCTLSDSGTISEESSILGFPALMLRESHERPECDEEGGVIMAGFDVKRVMESIEVAQRPIHTPDAYSVANVSDKVVRAIMSHTRR